MEKLKVIRKQRKISQKEFAHYMNVAQNTVSRWENGERLMDSDTLIKAANYFGVSTDYLLDINTKQQLKLDANQIRILKDFKILNDLGKREAVKRVNELTHIQAYSLREMPIAAHTDSPITEEELRLMREDIEDL